MRPLLLALLLPVVLFALLGCPHPTPPPAAAPPPLAPPPAPAPAPARPAAKPPPPAAKPPATTTSSPSLPKADDPEAWATYRGAWFSVRYPEGFRVVPRERSRTKTDGYDGVSFRSPDGRVEFYVFSPQWNGESEWTRLRSGETEEDRSTEKKGDSQAEQVTVRGPGYSRSWVDVTNAAQNTRHVFGYKYKNAAAYADFRPLYLKFKESLQQFAD
jgi:hypothetical protein